MESHWIDALVGGTIVGVGGAIFLLVNGRVLGSSGILGGLVDGSGRNSWAERVSFIIGLMGVPALLTLTSIDAQTYATKSALLLIAGGLLTGIGTRLANGCTSGHAISGISRFSPRAIAATLTYTSAGLITVAILRHALEAL